MALSNVDIRFRCRSLLSECYRRRRDGVAYFLGGDGIAGDSEYSHPIDRFWRREWSFLNEKKPLMMRGRIFIKGFHLTPASPGGCRVGHGPVGLVPRSGRRLLGPAPRWNVLENHEPNKRFCQVIFCSAR